MTHFQNKLKSLLLVLGMLCATFTFAQREGHKGNPEQHMQQHMERMQKDLNLTETQLTQLKPVFQELFAEKKQIHDDTSTDKEAKRASMKALEQRADAKVKPILTPEQFEKWKKIRAEHQRKGHKGGGHGQH